MTLITKTINRSAIGGSLISEIININLINIHCILIKKNPFLKIVRFMI